MSCSAEEQKIREQKTMSPTSPTLINTKKLSITENKKFDRTGSEKSVSGLTVHPVYMHVGTSAKV